MPVTGHIIGDQPRRELGNIPKTLIIQKRAKSKLDYRMDIRLHKGDTSLTQLGKNKRLQTQECMRYTIYYRQNIDNILAWKIIHNRLLG